jgi:hypothetical protein
VGRKKVGRQEQSRRQQALISGVVTGASPLDEQAADVIRQYLEAHHARQ